MIKKIKKTVSILLSLIMVFSLFTIVPLSASAAVGDVLSESEYLTFTAEEAGATVTLKVASGSDFQYDLNGAGLTDYTAGTEITLENKGDYVRFSGKDTTFNYSNHFSLTGKVAASGNVMSLRLDDDGKVQGLNSECFQYMFYYCQGLTTAPELPETNLANRCYYYMFYRCTSLTQAPELPATNLANSCYSYMFSGCTSLTKAPELPATELVDSCYYRMFYGCTSLTKAPELPATNLANSCYFYMFSGCTSLTKAPELPATNLAESCYSNMFYGCTSLTELPALPATTLARYCYNYMFCGCSNICISATYDADNYPEEYRIPSVGDGTSATGALSNMFGNTGGTFTGTPDIDTTYYVPAPAPTTHTITWKLDAETVIDTTEVEDGVVPTHADATKDADVFNTYTFTGWTPEIVAATADATYTATFDAVPFVASVTTNGTTTGYTSFSNAVSAWNNAANGSTLTLLDNVAISNIITINGTKILDLNDHRISMTGTDAIFYIGSGANLTLEDNATEKSTHYYSAAKNGSPGSVSDTADENHPYSFTGGYITGGKGYRTGNWRKGGVAYIAGGTFTINGGTLVGNQASGSGVSGGVEGGTIYATSGSFTLNGGNILADFSSNGAGGVFLEGTATFRMNGGSIKHCYAGYGAVIRNNNSADGAVILSGGTIAENISSHGKIIASGSMTVENVSIINNKGSVRSVIYVSGSPVIKDNTTSATDNTPRNVEVPNGKMINITGELTDGAEICVTMDTPGVFTDTTDTSLNVASKFFSDKSDYIVGKNDAGQLYLSKKLIAGHTLSLDGNIAINFYLDPSAAGLTAADVNSGNLSYSFAWVDQADTKAKVDVAEQARQSQAFTVSDDGKYIIVTCHVCAAEMTCGINASFTLGNKPESEVYSVRKYCDTVLHPTEEWLNAYKEKYPDGTAKCYRNLEELVEAMLNYGAMAQTKFGINTGTPDSSDTPGTSGKLANEGVTYNPGDVTTAMLEKAIADANPNETADNMNNVAAALGAKWFSTSLIYLDDSTLRHYFVKATDAFNPSAYTDNKSNYYYYVEKTGIPAAELDNLQTFNVGTESFKYSALDFVKGMINSSADGDSKNLAKSLYWYNQAANIYFHEHTPAEAVRENVVPATCTSAGSYDEVIYCSECHEELSREAKSIAIDPTAHTIVAVAEVPATHETAGVQEHYKCSGCGKLFSDAEGTTEITAEELAIPRNKKVKLDELTGDIKLLGGDIVSGTLEGNKKITVEPGATITLENANITSLNGSAGYAGITPLGDATILLVGENSVKGGGDRHAGIFAPNGYTLTIDGTGSLTAAPSNNAAGIGGSYTTSGNIVINGGTINATGAYGSAGIGSAFQHNCGSITINGGNITATGDSTAGAGIGSSFGGTCGKITINGGTITAIGGQGSAGIGASYNGNCGDITINNTVTKVSAQRGAYGPSAIGKGYGSPTCGTVTIGGEVVTIGTSPNPYVYEP